VADSDEEVELGNEGDLEDGEDGEQGVRPFWSGTLTFGLVSVPVELYSAVGQSRVSFHLLSPDGHPLRRRYVSSESQEPLEREQIVRGWKSDDRYVTVTTEELEALEPQRSREIDLRRFVARATIDPLYGDRAYFLLPDGEVTKPYRLLAATMEKTGRAGIATFVMRGREVAIAIYAERGILRAQTLRPPAEIRTAEAVGLPAPGAIDEALVTALKEAIAKDAKPTLDMKSLRDETAAAVRALAAKKKKAGKDVVEVDEALVTTHEDDDGMAPIVDIVSILKARLAAGAKATPAKAAAAKKAAPAKKSAVAKQAKKAAPAKKAKR